MKTATITTESGHSWQTSINGKDEEIRAYFIGKYFNIGAFDETKPNEGEKMERVTSVLITD